MRFEYWNSGDGKWSWHLKTAVGDIIARSIAFASRESCLAAIRQVKLAAGSRGRDCIVGAEQIDVRTRIEPLRSYPGF